MIGKYLTEIACLECGAVQAADAVASAACPVCGSGWLDAHYDYDAVAPLWRKGIGARPHTLWRYGELLPIEPTFPEVLMGEGYTPLNRLYPYEAMYGHKALYVKDERAQPTNSFKDRQAALSVMLMKQKGITECVLASTGNAAVAYAAYCARSGIKLWLFVTSLVPPEKMREAALYGCEVVKVSGTYDETKKVAADFAQRRGIHFDRGAKAVPGKESMKTVAYEIAEQLGLAKNPRSKHRWIAPDWYVQAVSGGIGPLGVWKGFDELYRMKLIDRMPKLAIVQAEGCSPMVRAFKAGESKAEPVTPQTLITVLATGDPGYAYTLLYNAVTSNGGTMLAIEDGETFRAMRHLASRGGMSVEPATAVAFGGLEKMLLDGTIKPEETVVVNCSRHTFAAESHILGDQYERYVHDIELSQKTGRAVISYEEGLGAALKTLAERVTTIVVVDDNPNDRRLIRRLLQSSRRYRVFEARDSVEALRVIEERQPDLIVIDLIMPDMDGFTLLEKVKSNPQTASIPVVVVSAKSLTGADRTLLETRAASIWQKGDLDTQQLVEHVVEVLGHEKLEIVRPTHERTAVAFGPLEEIVYTHTILVIDDNPYDLRLAKRILQSQKQYSVIEAPNGREGLKAVYNYHPDMIVLDLNLPDVDGFSIVETLQKDANLQDIPVIIYTAADMTEAERNRLKNIRQVMKKGIMDKQQFLDVIKDGLAGN